MNKPITREQTDAWLDEAREIQDMRTRCMFFTIICSLAAEDEPEDEPDFPAPIEWEVGDWAIHRDHGLVKIDYMHKTSCILSCGLIVMLSNLRIPTRDQLGVEIGDSGVMAWACEVGDKVMLYFSNGTEWYGGTDRNTDVMRHMCEALGIIVLTRSQAERHYGGAYPPEK